VDRLQQPAGTGEHDIGQHKRHTEHVGRRYSFESRGIECCHGYGIGDHGFEDHGIEDHGIAVDV
jgi:hypothetical protein